MVDVNWDERRNLAAEAALDPAEREAVETDFGFRVCNDAPAAFGGGTTWFYWFETRRELLAFLGEHSILMNPAGFLDHGEGNNLAVADAAIKRAVTEVGVGDLEPVRVVLNKHLKGSSQFSWLGSFTELREGDHPEAKNVRGEFREENEMPGGTGPIDRKDTEAFAEFLAAYGV